MLYFTADYCGICKKMERDTWSNPQVAKRITTSFVALKIDAEKHPQLVKRFKIEGLPTTIVFDQDGAQQPTLTGYTRSAAVMELLDSVTPVAPVAGRTVAAPR